MTEKDKKSNFSLKLFVILLVWIISVYAAITFIRSSDEPPCKSESLPVKHKGVCKSPECITLAHQLHNWRDVSVDPCENFFEAACGKYNENNLESKTRLSTKTGIVARLIKEFLDKNLPSTSNSENAMHFLYQKCQESNKLNATEIAEQEAKSQLELITRIGSAPVFGRNWNEADFDLNDMMAAMAKLGRDQFGFLKFVIHNQYLVIIRDPITSEALESGIKKILNETLRLIYERPDADQIGRDVKDVIKLNDELQEPNTNVSGGIYSSEFQENVPSLDFTRIIKSLIDPRRKEEVWERIQNRTVGLNDALYYSDGKKNLETILQSSSNRTLANYLMIRFLISLEKQKTSGKDDCTEEVIEKLPLASLRMFARNHFDKENLQIASDIVEDIIGSFVETIQKSSWLHETTKQRAIKKVKNMKKVIGYPKELEVPGTLDRFFESLNLSDINMTYFQTKIEIERFRTIQSMNHFAALFPFESSSDYLITNAFYHPTINKLTLNVAFLDDPFFDSTYPKYAKVASIGEVIGHEIGHGYDPFGRQRDENGKESNWWTPEDSAEYDRRTQCLINQYNEYDDPDFGRNLNGTTTIKEIASDMIGVETSWRTYKKVDFSNEPSIFGFEDEKPDKLFFHLTALNWCSSRSEVSLAEQLTRTHPTYSFRVNGVFSNMKSFAEAFNCPVGSPMNPEKKCHVF
ncbi:hypothetical protein GCK72_015361 [Caenorhabditis remanei]|uniref:Peptidase M13 C-terminal domain-containing protein n=1 Tax=Caenorhabditis remanei TaxID=31234 RepID=A0A6A5GWA9_CAERE|nr:hypothetical protein GCK72_015361 [Caenorhabditis remanei]KAF1758901.1 hypothetical protein GCK72_015361 [Caenorhabditis remanei]